MWALIVFAVTAVVAAVVVVFVALVDVEAGRSAAGDDPDRLRRDVRRCRAVASRAATRARQRDGQRRRAIAPR